MKKVLFITMLFLATATLSAQVQLPRQSDPQQHQLIKNVEANYMKSYNHKGKPHLKQTDLSKSNKTDERSTREVRRQERRYKYANGLASDDLRSHLNYLDAYWKKQMAKRKKEKAESDLAELIRAQQREKAELQALIDQAQAEGRDCGGLLEEMRLLGNKHSVQLYMAQEKVEKADANYNRTLRNQKDVDRSRVNDSRPAR